MMKIIFKTLFSFILIPQLIAKNLFNFLREIWVRAQYATQGVHIAQDVIIRTGKNCKLLLENGVKVGRGTLMILLPDTEKLSQLFIGNGTAINEYNNIRATGGVIRIGKNCQIAQFCSIIARNHTIETDQYMIDAPLAINKNQINIGDDVLVCANVVIVPGVTIGRGAVIGAGSVVTSDVPEYAIYAGVPARLIRYRQIHA